MPGTDYVSAINVHICRSCPRPSQVGRRHMRTRFYIKKISHFSKVPPHTGLTISIAEKEKEDTESHKIDELYEFSSDSSLD